jgi:hypothetical protein
MSGQPSIWIDFENAPHVWVLSKIIWHLQEKGFPILMTARDFSYVVGLCNYFGFKVKVIGTPGGGKNKIDKIYKLLERSFQLYRFLFSSRKKYKLALSHGSRSQIITSKLLGIPMLSLDDYEHSDQSLVRFMDVLLVPFPIPLQIWGRNAGRVSHYPGLKEELYLCDFQPKEIIGDFNNISGIKILFRPESSTAHYHSDQSQVLQNAILEYISGHENIELVILPRDNAQSEMLAQFCRQHSIPFWIPEQVLDGPSLMCNMDLVIGGGGTMTREAAMLGVPAYTFFAGKWGAVDQYLVNQGRLHRITDSLDVHQIALVKKGTQPVEISRKALDFVLDAIENYLV